MSEPRIYRDRVGRCAKHDADVCEACPGDSLAADVARLVEAAEALLVPAYRAGLGREKRALDAALAPFRGGR